MTADDLRAAAAASRARNGTVTITCTDALAALDAERALEAWTCRVCGAAFQAPPGQVAQRMAHHVENHRVTEEGLADG